MKNRIHGAIATGLVCAALGVGWFDDARAEVSARLDRQGAQQGAQVVPGGERGTTRPWSQVEGRRAGKGRRAVLNPRGASNGDLWPSIAENPVAPHEPWAVWSRGNGSRYDLVWSRWTPLGWQQVQWVFADRDGGHDLDADIQLDGTGRPFIVWWREGQGGFGRVFLSMHLNRRWMTPFAVSEERTDARYPSVQVEADGTIVVEYETRAGTVSQTVGFNRPVTITDDINPQLHFSPLGRPVLIRRNPGY